MNHNKLYFLFKENLFTDLVLTLKDDANEVTMNVHKNVLYINCPYFEKLLTNCKEKNSNDIAITVPNMYVAYDIIMEFYGQTTNLGNLPSWRHLLEVIRCRDFWGLDLGSMANIIVPPEGFELLLNVIELIGYDDDTIRVIIKNLPPDYDLSMFPKELINEIPRIMGKHVVVSGCWNSGIKIWDANTGELIRTLDEHTGSVHSVCYSPDNKRIVSGSSNKSIQIWDATTWELLRTLDGHDNCVSSVCYSSDNKRIISGSWDKSIKIWNAATGELIQTLNGHDNGVSSVCYSSDNKRIVSGSWDKSIKIWDATTGELIRTLNEHNYCVRSVCYSSDNKRITSGSLDKSIKIWDADTGKLILTLNGHSDRVCSVCYSSNNNRIVSGSLDKSIKIWDATTGELILTLNGPPKVGNIVSNLLGAPSNFVQGQSYRGHDDGVSSVCYSPDNKRIISGSWDKSIKIWDATTGELIQTLNTQSSVYSICSSYYDNELIERIKKLTL